MTIKPAFEVLVLPGSNLILLAALTEPLRAANRVLGSNHFECDLFSVDGAPVKTTVGIDVPVSGVFDAKSRVQLLVSASYGVAELLPDLRQRLVQTARFRSFIGAADGAVRLLADAGLYKGYQCALHAEDVDEMSDQYQDVMLSRRRWVIDRDRSSARGSGSAIEMMLALIEQSVDRPTAEAVARLFDFVPADATSPPGDAVPGLRDDRIARVLNVMSNHISDPLGIDQLATMVGVSTRGLFNLFERSLRQSPQQVYVQLRLERARQLLVETDWPVSAVANQCGYLHTASLTRAYRAAFGETPSLTRRQG